MRGRVGTVVVDRDGERCSACPHPFDPHVLVAVGNDPLDGGLLVCPEPGCLCVCTWGVNGAAGAGRPLRPDQRDAVRRHVQGLG